MDQNVVILEIVGYDEGTDLYTLSAWGFEEEHWDEFPAYCMGCADFDDFKVPGIVLPAMMGEYGEPAELIGRKFHLELPKAAQTTQEEGATT